LALKRGTPIDALLLRGIARYALTCYRYIEPNPVRAEMVRARGDYRWSSRGHNALGADQALIKPHAAYLALGDTKGSRCERYRTLVAERLPPEEREEIRRHTSAALRRRDS